MSEVRNNLNVDEKISPCVHNRLRLQFSCDKLLSILERTA